METSKKWRGRVVNGKRKVDTRTLNGHLVSAETFSRWEKLAVWDASFYNFRTGKWEPEGTRRTYTQAYARANYLSRQNPYCQVGVTLVPGYSRVKKQDLAPVADSEETK